METFAKCAECGGSGNGPVVTINGDPLFGDCPACKGEGYVPVPAVERSEMKGRIEAYGAACANAVGAAEHASAEESDEYEREAERLLAEIIALIPPAGEVEGLLARARDNDFYLMVETFHGRWRAAADSPRGGYNEIVDGDYVTAMRKVLEHAEAALAKAGGGE